MNTIVIAPTVRDGRARFPRAVAVLTPKAPHGARGQSAARIVTLRTMNGNPARERLLREALPALRHPVTDPTAVRLERAKNRGADDQERQEAGHENAEKPGANPDDQQAIDGVIHAPEASA